MGFEEVNQVWGRRGLFAFQYSLRVSHTPAVNQGFGFRFAYTFFNGVNKSRLCLLVFAFICYGIWKHIKTVLKKRSFQVSYIQIGTCHMNREQKDNSRSPFLFLDI
jgi:hypothetical protein